MYLGLIVIEVTPDPGLPKTFKDFSVPKPIDSTGSK